MSYLVLARKYRPKSFGEVAGQDVVTRTLRGAIAEERVGHAYLFFGPRGTGKTTSARLFAKALNCEQGPTAEPCGVCARCVACDTGTETDLIEIDAASNTGVDHVRSLRDQAGYVPIQARFKVFLVDEVHMLSKPAFNALLKTLEEPPPHVKFLFATTELHKVPDTVVSRCQVLRLSPLSESEITGRLDEVFELEGIDAEAGVSAEIARRARGGMRDALSLADQLLALVGRTPRVVDTGRLAGETSTDAIEAVLDAMLDGNKVALLGGLPPREGDEPAFLDSLLDYLRSALLLAVIGDDAPMLASSAGPEARQAMKGRATRFGADRLELVLQDLLHARERMGPIHMRAHARLILESALLDLCRPEATMPLGALIERLEALEGRAPAALSPPGPPAGPPAGPSSAPSSAPRSAPRSGPARGAASSGPPPDRPPQQPSSAPRDGEGRGAEIAPTSPKTAYVPPARRAEPGRPEGGGAPQAAAPPEAVPVREVQPAPRRRGRAPAPRVQTNSTADRWEGFLKELRGRHHDLAEVILRKGRLVRESGGVAPLKLLDLTPAERAAVGEPAARTALAAAFAAANGDAIRLKVELHNGRDGLDDPFTKEISEMFGGHLDD